MYEQHFWSFVAVMVCLGSGSTYATISAEDMSAMKETMQPFINECIEELGITEEQLAAFKSKESDEDVDPCFMSCFFKKTGLFTSDGMYDVNQAKELTEAHVKDEKDLEIFDNIRKECAKVNDADVSDDCERALLLMNCFKEHKDEVDFSL